MIIRLALLAMVTGPGSNLALQESGAMEVASIAEAQPAVAGVFMPMGTDAFAAETPLPSPTMIEVVDLDAPSPRPVATPDPDAAFRVAVGEMATAFAADIAAEASAGPVVVDIQMCDDVDPALADVPGYGTIADAPPSVATPSLATTRLADAVRLTARAAEAWSALIP